MATLSNLKAINLKPLPTAKSYPVDTGLSLKVLPDGAKVFDFRYTFNGKRCLLSLGVFTKATDKNAVIVSLDTAKKMALEYRAMIAAGINPSDVRKEEKSKVVTTFKELVELYIVKVLPTHKGQRSDTIRLQKFIRENTLLVNKNIEDVTPTDLDKWQNKRLTQGVSNDSVNRERQTISPIFTHAVKVLRLLNENPFSKVPMLENSRGRDRRVTDLEIEQIKLAVNYDCTYAPITATQKMVWCFLFSCETAMRLSEVLGMTWENIKTDGDCTYVFLPDTKNGEHRTVPLLDDALILLNLMRGIDPITVLPKIKVDDAIAFDKQAKAASSLFKKLITTKTSIKNLRYHDSRHEACSRLVKAGVAVNDLAKISGHKDINILQRVYYNPTAKELYDTVRHAKDLRIVEKDRIKAHFANIG